MPGTFFNAPIRSNPTVPSPKSENKDSKEKTDETDETVAKAEKAEPAKKHIIPARLIMRQENTHKVILNTAIIRELKFEEKLSNAAGKQYMFMAFDNGKPVNMLLKVS